MELFDTKFISGHWPLTNVAIGSTLQQSGERVVYKVVSDQLLYLSWRLHQTKIQLEKDTHIFPYLWSNNLNAPQLLSAANGENFVEINNQYVYVIGI